MGTYTTNKNLFMPTVGEQGWGTLVNGNFETIDNLLKPITVSGSTYTFTGSHVGNQSGGSISATSISNSGTLTSTGKITANGGIGTTSLTTSSTITSTGKITANGGIGTKALTATSISNSGNMTNTGTLTCTGKIYANGGIEGAVSSLSKVVTVTPTSNYSSTINTTAGMLLPPIPGVTYTGSLKFYGDSEYYSTLKYCTSPDKIHSPTGRSGEGMYTITLTDALMFYIVEHAWLATCSFTLS